MNSPTLVIRPFRTEDSESVVSLASELGLSWWTLKDYRDELNRRDSVMLVEANDSKVVGFIVGRRVPGSESGDGQDAEIYNIGVDREFQRLGVGSRLIFGFIDRCRIAGVQDIWLDVRSANDGAIRFYRKFGFVEYTRRPDFYRNPPDDGIIMRLTLC